VSQCLDSGALLLVRRALGLAGPGSSETVLDDGNLSQVLDVNPIVRRSRTLAGTQGIFMAVMENDHGAGATSLSSTVDPYAPGGLNNAPYPHPVPLPFDVWILGLAAITAGGTVTNADEARFAYRTTAAMQGFSVDDGGLAVSIAAKSFGLGFVWDDWTNGRGMNSLTRQMSWEGALRVRRGVSFLFTSNATNAVTIQCLVLVGLFPVALGQDALQK